MILLSFIPYAVYGGTQTGSDDNAAGVGGIRRRLTTCMVGVPW